MKEFVLKLYDPARCMVCRANYDFTSHIPRILIHCGHTFCSECLQLVFKNLAIKCMLCDVVVKKLEKVNALPVNHTIMLRLTKEQNKKKQYLEFEKKAKLIMGDDDDND